ncbi:MAG: arginine repressor [Deltaproteobacteria bacterium]|nr:MAG: arginine repressor [Deltaproteobacteria bacterium]
MRLVREKAGKHERQEEIRRLLRARRISTQQELAELLAAQGIEATQATLSRDLAELGVLRVSRPEGAVYELEPVNASATPQLAELGETILSLRENDFLVVLRTRPGMASAVALAIDNTRMPECLGTLAGDDTIFATPARGIATRRLAQQIRSLFGRESL